MSVLRPEPVELILARTAARWRAAEREIVGVAESLLSAVQAPVYEALAPGLGHGLVNMQEAVGRFEDAAKHPEVVVATTGTTSSGKSTIANLLIGDELLPKAVQEMSAGVVTVRHDSATRGLTVEATRGARWPTGSWSAESAEEVRSRLERTMETYRDLVADEEGGLRTQIEPPRFLITWTTRMGSNPAEFGLPAGARLSIVDLPGLKYADDDLNGSVMREHARKALCLVAYNSFETDPKRQEALLRQVVDQVKAMSGSPARMLFVLNRIDAYRTDRDPAASERSFTERVTRQICTGILEALPEYASEAESIEPVALSSEPALYTVLVEGADPARGAALLRKMSREYALLFPDQEMDELDRSPAKWTEPQRRWFLTEARHQSRLSAFEGRLGSHIAAHLPELLLPDLVEATYHPMREVLLKLDALVEAYNQREQSDAKAARERLEDLHRRLRELQKEAMRPLDPLKTALTGEGDFIGRLADAVPRVESALGLARQRSGHGPLSALSTALPEAVAGPMQRLNDHVFRLMQGEEFEDPFIQSSGSAARLRAAVAALHSSPYRRVWMTGGTFEADEGGRVQSALDGFAKELSAMASSLVLRESSVQAERMRLALATCGEAVVSRLEVEAGAELKKFNFQGLRGVFRGSFELKPPRLPPVRFAASVKSWTKVESRTVQETNWVLKRVWWKLWLGKSYVAETRSVVRTTTRNGIEVGKLGDLLEGFAHSAAVGDLEELFAGWLAESLADFDKTLEARLKDGVKTYRLALEQRMDEIDRGARSRIENAERYRTDVQGLLATLERLRQWRSA